MKRRNIEAWAGICGGTGAALILVAFGMFFERAQHVDPAAGFVIGLILAGFAIGLTVALLAKDEEEQ